MTPYEAWEAWVMSVTAMWLGFVRRTSAHSDADWAETIGEVKRLGEDSAINAIEAAGK